MLRVLCSDSELDENGEVITVGDGVSRLAGRVQGTYFGTDLGSIDLHFDQYAEDLGHESATVSGRVAAISAVHVRRSRGDEGGWTAQPGSAHLEPLETTAATRKPREVIDWGPPSAPHENGRRYSLGRARIKEGDELLHGWVFRLDPWNIQLRSPSR
ncbi:hypothetical protein [Amnibacterium kyonggiense]